MVPLTISYFYLFITIILYIRTASKSNSILQNYSLNYIYFCYILIYIRYLSRYLISLSSSPYESTYTPFSNPIDLYSHYSSRTSYILLIFTVQLFYAFNLYILFHTYLLCFCRLFLIGSPYL